MRHSHVTLRLQLKRARITQAAVAQAAKVGRTMVVHTLAGRTTSRNVIETAKRLLAEAKSAP